MTSPVDTVEAFLARLGEPGGFVTAVREWFTPATVYENIGMSKTTGVEEAAAFAEQFVTGSGAVAIRVENRAVAMVGNTVLTERIDHVVDAAGNTTMSIPLMGIFVVDHGKIVEWRDYFDTAPFRG